jgi:hypothetical protein
MDGWMDESIDRSIGECSLMINLPALQHEQAQREEDVDAGRIIVVSNVRDQDRWLHCRSSDIFDSGC